VQALEVEPSAAVYEARANANIELEKYMEAVQDASKAIELDSSNAKAYLRKGWVWTGAAVPRWCT
jgi:Flp pilus assembly protein TadD